MVVLDGELQIYRRRLYDTESGHPERGDLFWADWYHPSSGVFACLHGWSNCNGPHLIAVLPNGRHWDIDSRASNCTKREDATHRCWVREGDPPNITVSKNGRTCEAGAGSVLAGDWHGFLRFGYFEKA